MSKKSQFDDDVNPGGTGIFGETSDRDNDRLVSIVGAVFAIGAGWAVRKSLDTAWQKSRGHRPPKPGEGVIGEVVAAAAITAGLAALAQVLSQRAARRWLRR